MKLYEMILKEHEKNTYKNFHVINISNEIWLAFIREMRKWKASDIYAISFFIDYDIDMQSQLLLHFGYNTESHYKRELCDDVDSETIRWNYNFWLQNETFCFGEDEYTNGMISEWIRQQKIRDFEAVDMFVDGVVDAVFQYAYVSSCVCGSYDELFQKREGKNRRLALLRTWSYIHWT